MLSPEVGHEREDAVGSICCSLRRRSYGGGYVNRAAGPGQQVRRGLIGRDILLGGATGLAAAALGVLFGLGLFVGYIQAVEAIYDGPEFPDFDSTGSRDFVVRGLQALSLLLFAVFLIAPVGLAYWIARTLRANTLVAAVTAGLLLATLALPALVALSAASDCLMGRSFLIPGTYCD